MPSIKASIACIGKFHHFDLARQLYKRNMLERIFTGYPLWKLRDEQIPQRLITTFPWLQTLSIGLERWEFLNQKTKRELAWWSHKTFDHFVKAAMPESHILFALSSSVLEAGKKMQEQGGMFVCDRGSSHIRYQDAILRDEYARWGADFQGVDSRILSSDEESYEIADLITVPSSFSYRTFLQHGIPERKLRKVPYGVDITRFQKIADVSSEWFDVLFVGQVGFRKGIPYLLNAFQSFKHPKKRLTIVGAIQPEIKSFLNQLQMSENIRFLGVVPQTELKYIMSSSHTMVLPSIEEGLALVQAQALACGCPVIGTEHSGAEDIYTNDVEGFIIPIRNPKAITEKLQVLADNPLKHQTMSAAALQRVQSLGGWDTYGNHMAQIFTDLCSVEIIEKTN